MNWTDFPDAIYAISLPKSHERRKAFLKEMAEYDIPVSIWPGIHHVNGAEGLRQTYMEIFENSIANGFDSILVFEDDSCVVDKNIREIMDRVIDQLPADWDMCYLGCNAFGGFDSFYSAHLLKINDHIYTSHAVMYSAKAMNEIIENLGRSPLAYDTVVATLSQPFLNCFATYPLLCSQKAGYSEIEKKDVDYAWLIQQRFTDKVRQIK